MTGQPFDELTPADASPGDTLYIADRDLNIVRVNDEWRSFARSNNGASLLGEKWNSHLLTNFSGSERIRWTAIYKALLSGRLPSHEENFQCPSPVERRTYRLRISPHHDATGAVDYLVHHAVRIDQKPVEKTLLQERLKALDADPRMTVEAYRAHVMARRIHPVQFRTARHFQPLEEVGGDLLWHRAYEGGRTDLVVADVMGHGRDAARLAAKIVFLLDTITETEQCVPENVARLSKLLLEQIEDSPAGISCPLFATGLYLRMNPRQQSLAICSFGHCGPIFSKAGYIALEAGMPVGIIKDPDPWVEAILSLIDHGRRFLIFTDGVTEQFNMDGQMFGESALEREFQRTLHLSLPAMLEELCACVEAFRGKALIKDDQTMLGLEYIN